MLWRDPRRAGLLMLACFLISLPLGPVFYVSGSGGHPGTAGDVSGAAFTAFFAWRVTRGGRVSRMLLTAGAGLAFLGTAAGLASRPGLVTFAVLAACAAQFALLISPAVYLRTRGPGWVAPPGWDRIRPPAAPLVLLGVLAGLAGTLSGLASVHFPEPAPWCAHGAGPAALCGTVARGEPLQWLTAYRGAPAVSWAAMARDWAQYTVMGTALLYGLWLATLARREPTRGRGPAAAVVVGSVLAGLAVAAVTGGVPLTWLTIRHGTPMPNVRALLADTAVLALAALGGWLAVRVLAPGWRRAGPGTPAEL